ncbi:MAG: FtsX-like permease family protein [Anaerolineales bacterium]|nr:FtsX-like permease family protein [Anaerolineales bacterium]
MNPLSPLLYYSRHKAWTLVLAGLLASASVAVYLVIGLLYETYITPLYVTNRYLSRFSLVQAEDASALDPSAVEAVRGNPDVARILPQRSLELWVPNLGVTVSPFRLIGLREEDRGAVLELCGVELAEGRLPESGTNEAALSREIAAALGLGIGGTMEWSADEMAYVSLAAPLTVVGLLEGEVRLGIVSYEYLSGSQPYGGLTRDGLLVIPRPGRGGAVDDFLRGSAGEFRFVPATDSLFREKAGRDQRAMIAIGIPLVLLVTAAIALVVGSVNRIVFLRRLPEFGTLLAVGRDKGWLLRRLTAETALLALLGTGLGILTACGVMAVINAAWFEPNGFGFPLVNPVELLTVAPLPLAVIGFTLYSTMRALWKMDPVAIVERGELSMEQARIGGRGSGSLKRPLDPAVFYRRHISQALALVGATALMIMGTALFVFIAEIFDDARQPMLHHLQRMSLVSPGGAPINEGTEQAIRSFPSTGRVIPAYVFSALGIDIPPVTPNYPGETYAVSADDLLYLVDLFGLELAEGRLPRAGTNELAVPWTFARNRSLHVGDIIGDPSDPLYPDAPGLPSPLVVSGVFQPAESYAAENWLSFASLEFVEAGRGDWAGPLSMIVLPRAGQKAELDAYLDREAGGGELRVLTYGNQTAEFRRQERELVAVLGLLEGVIAAVAALTLAGLNYVFFLGRRKEFGVLQALGFTRRRLVWRGACEGLAAAGAAWLAAVLLFAAIAIGIQLWLYTPAGIQLNFFNPTPWLFTLPVPAAVTAAVAAALAWMLSRMDPVEVIERR